MRTMEASLVVFEGNASVNCSEYVATTMTLLPYLPQVRGVALVKPEERIAVSDMVSERLSQWRKRKRMFKDLASINRFTICDYELSLQEELGIEYDEDAGVNLQSFSDLVQPADKRRRFK
ncbi:Homologous-pairing protein 2 homolog [Linum grandiflorum]